MQKESELQRNKNHTNEPYSRPQSRATSLEQLSLAEFSDEYARSKVYENDHENVLGIWLDLVSNVKYSTILIF